MSARFFQTAREILDQRRELIFVVIAGATMPFAVALLSHYVGHSHFTQSISAYYYSDARDLLVMTLTLAALLLIGYRGREVGAPLLRQFPCEYWVSTVGGLLAFAIALFPMNRMSALAELGLTGLYSPGETFVESLCPWHAEIHVACAMLFFTFAAMLSFLFSRDKAKAPSGWFIVYLLRQTCDGIFQHWSRGHRGLVFKSWGLAIAFGLAWGAYNILIDKEIYWPEVEMLAGFCGCWLSKLCVRIELEPA